MARKTVPKSFQEMATDHLKCRSLLHPWDFDPSVKFTEVRQHHDRKVWVFPLVCERCGATKELMIYASGDDAGRPVQRGINYAGTEGYLIEGVNLWGGRGALLANARRELLARMMNGRKRG